MGISDKIAVVTIAIDETKIFPIDYSDDPIAIPTWQPSWRDDSKGISQKVCCTFRVFFVVAVVVCLLNLLVFFFCRFLPQRRGCSGTLLTITLNNQ